MNRTLKELLPDEISDEVAYHVSNFIMELATIIDETYFAQSLRYIRSREYARSVDYQRKNYIAADDEPPF